LKANPHV